jgi:hypothetical protein
MWTKLFFFFFIAALSWRKLKRHLGPSLTSADDFVRKVPKI